MAKQVLWITALLLYACAAPTPRRPANAPAVKPVIGRCQIPVLGLVNEKALLIEPRDAYVGERPESGYFTREIPTKLGKKLRFVASQGRLTVTIDNENGDAEAKVITPFPVMVSPRASLTPDDHKVIAFHSTIFNLVDDNNVKIEVACSIEPVLNSREACGPEQAFYCINL